MMPHRRCRPNGLQLRYFHRLRLSLPGLARPACLRREDAIYLYNQIVKDLASPAPIGDSAASRQSAGLKLSAKAQAPTIDNSNSLLSGNREFSGDTTDCQRPLQPVFSALSFSGANRLPSCYLGLPPDESLLAFSPDDRHSLRAGWDSFLE